MSYRKVLVPLDGSELAERSLRYADKIAGSNGGEVILFTVSASSDDRLERPMKAYLDLNAKELQSQRIRASTAIAYGSVADEIIDFAHKSKIDLIIISTHGYSGIKHWMMGSIARKVLYGTHVPVFLVKSRSPKVSRVKFEKILLPLDGSPFSETSIPHVEQLMRGTQAEIILLRVSEPPIVPSDRSPAIKPSWEQYRDMLMAEVQQQALKYLEKVKAGFEGRGMKVKSEVLLGKAIESILQVARKENADLIAITTHGRTGVSRWVYGSVVNRVVEESLQPVLLIRPSTPEGPST
ncbi:MAG: universal stress protein [Dehalococcoidia bacterium]|nr:universal stress protein [Dehalococcoidia bacterium]